MDKVAVFALVLLFCVDLGEHGALSRNNVDLIIGGEIANIGEAPYQIILLFQSRFICSGSIISKRTVVTAAHCFINSNISADYSVVAGTNYRNGSGGVTYGVSILVKHDNFGVPYFGHNDIALLILDKDVVSTNLIQSIKLDAREHLKSIKVKTTGWGLTDPNSSITSPVLKKLSKQTITNEECQSFHVDKIIDGGMLCTESVTSSRTCNGDSGGPTVNTQGELVGIVSWGRNHCVTGFPDVYTRVSSFIDWIKDNGVF